jgi:ribosomal protein S18 acetylase RimI-like enzyme
LVPYEETDLRRFVRDLGADHLVIDDLQVDDLEGLGWSGSPVHLRHVADDLQRVEGGGIDYLAARLPDGTPVAKGGVDYVDEPGQGSIYQLVTRAELRGLGIGTRLIREAEERIRARALPVVRLGVEVDNARARALYERLGYVATGERPAAWEDMRPDGSVFTYETVLTEMKKRLGPS